MSTTGQQYLDNYDPRKVKPSNRKRVIRVDEFENPIPNEIRDVGEYKKFFETFGDVFVPYAGTDKYTSHGLLNFLSYLGNMHTQGACKESIKTFAFGGKLKIVRNEDPVFDLGESNESTPANVLDYYNFIKENVGFYDAGQTQVNPLDFSLFQFDPYKDVGNCFTEIVRSETLGQKSFKVYIHKPENCLYLATDKGEQRYIAISPIWDVNYLRAHPPRILPLFPAYVEQEDGVSRSIIHTKSGNYSWYGRPDWIGGFTYSYREMQAVMYQIKLARGNFTGQVIIEVEDENPEVYRLEEEKAKEAGFESFNARLEENFTQNGDDPSTILYITRPYGAKPVEIAQIEPNTNESWYEVTGKIAKQNVIRSNGWSERLLGESSASGFSDTVFLSELETKKSLIAKYRMKMGSLLNTILKEATKYFETSDFDDLSIDFSSPNFEFDFGDNGSEDDNNTVGGDQGSTGQQ